MCIRDSPCSSFPSWRKSRRSLPLPGRLVCRHELRKRIIRSAGPTRSARKLEVPGIVGMTKTTRTWVREFSASPRDRVPQASAASARSAVRQNGGTKKDLSFSSKDRSLTCGATFTIDSADAEPSHEHANTCSALDAGSRSRYSVASRRACALRPPTFPLSLGEPFTIQLTAGIPAAPALCECS